MAREAPYLIRCLIVAQYADSMRDDALTVLSRSIQRSEPYSARDLAYGLGLSVVECRRRVVDWGGGIDGNGNVLFQCRRLLMKKALMNTPSLMKV